MSLIGLLVVVLIACVVLWATRALLGAFSVPAPVSTVIYVVAVLIVLLWVLGSLGVGVPGLRLR